MAIHSWTLVALFALAGCTRCTPTPAPVPPPVPAADAGPPPAPPPAPPPVDAAAEDATPPSVDAEACGVMPTCADVCCHGRALGCDWAKPSPAGTACELLCAAYTDPQAKPLLRWNLTACVTAKTCSDCR